MILLNLFIGLYIYIYIYKIYYSFIYLFMFNFQMRINMKKLILLVCLGSLLLMIVYNSQIGQSSTSHNRIWTLVKTNADSTSKFVYNQYRKHMELPSIAWSRMFVKDNSSTISNFTTNYVVATRKEKYIIYICDGPRWCGGWGDRQRGIASSFLLANLTNRKFILNMKSPCDLNNFLEPNEYNWTMANFEVNGKTSRIIDRTKATDYQKLIGTKDFNLNFPEDIIFVRTNSDFLHVVTKIYKDKIPEWARGKRYKAFKNAWRILFKPSKNLKKQLNKLLTGVVASSNDSLVCAHIRLGKNPDLPNDSPNRNNVSSVPELWRFLQRYADRASKVFIATDSTSVRDLARAQFGEKSFDTGGKILHIDRQRRRKDSCRGLETALLDQMILTKCHVLVVSQSSFSIRAAFIRGTNKNLFIFKNGKVSPYVLK